MTIVVSSLSLEIDAQRRRYTGELSATVRAQILTLDWLWVAC